ncbi:hypothetical protein Tco_0686900 [Tanacetum coccineum]
MSDNIPFDIQMQIIKKVSDVKSLIQFSGLDIPKAYTDELYYVRLSVSSQGEGYLVVSGYIMVEGPLSCGVWVMEHDSSFRKLFTIRALVFKIVGFSKSGETIFESEKRDGIASVLLHGLLQGNRTFA